MRTTSYGIIAVVIFLLGLGIGFFLWGLRSAELQRAVRRERAECEERVAEATRRAQAAEQRIEQEVRARRVVEDALNRVSPQK